MNRFEKQRKIISDRKFDRIFAQNLNAAGTAFIMKNWEIKNSLQSVKVGSHVYCRFACHDQKANRLKVYNVRYLVEDGKTLDYLSFQPYPSPVFARVEF